MGLGLGKSGSPGQLLVINLTNHSALSAVVKESLMIKNNATIGRMVMWWCFMYHVLWGLLAAEVGTRRNGQGQLCPPLGQHLAVWNVAFSLKSP